MGCFLFEHVTEESQSLEPRTSYVLQSFGEHAQVCSQMSFVRFRVRRLANEETSSHIPLVLVLFLCFLALYTDVAS